MESNQVISNLKYISKLQGDLRAWPVKEILLCKFIASINLRQKKCSPNLNRDSVTFACGSFRLNKCKQHNGLGSDHKINHCLEAVEL